MNLLDAKLRLCKIGENLAFRLLLSLHGIQVNWAPIKLPNH